MWKVVAALGVIAVMAVVAAMRFSSTRIDPRVNAAPRARAAVAADFWAPRQPATTPGSIKAGVMPHPAQERPNMVLLLADQWRFDWDGLGVSRPGQKNKPPLRLPTTMFMAVGSGKKK